MTALFENVYVHVMQFILFFFSLFYRPTVFRYFWVVSLDVDFIIKTPFSISVDPGSLSPSRLSVTVSRYN